MGEDKDQFQNTCALLGDEEYQDNDDDTEVVESEEEICNILLSYDRYSTREEIIDASANDSDDAEDPLAWN
jgi:hypothetical protein